MEGIDLPNADRSKLLHKLFPGGDASKLSTTDSKTLIAYVLSALNIAAVFVLELTNPLGASSVAVLAATATTNGPQTIIAFLAPGLAELLARPRNLRFTTGGATAAHAPNQVIITGTDIDGNVLTETLALSQIAGNDDSLKAFATLTSLAYTGGTGVDATVSVGYANKFGLPKSIKTRAGRLAVIQEVDPSGVVTTGTFASPATSPPHGTYSPADVPDGTDSYAVTFEAIQP